jgi:hypothetical protein
MAIIITTLLPVYQHGDEAEVLEEVMANEVEVPKEVQRDKPEVIRGLAQVMSPEAAKGAPRATTVSLASNPEHVRTVGLDSRQCSMLML